MEASRLGSTPLADLAVIFDLDGTLADSWSEVITAVRLTLGSRYEGPIARLARSRAKSDLAAPELFAALGVPESEVADHVATFRTELSRIIGTSVTAMEGADRTLRTLRSHGAYLAVATNKPRSLAVATLRAVKMESMIDSLVTTDEFAPKPEPAMVRFCHGASGRSYAVMVGDSPKDVQAARGAGIPAIHLCLAERHSSDVFRDVTCAASLEEVSAAILNHLGSPI
jgi:phosphoglycolate phosphatase